MKNKDFITSSQMVSILKSGMISIGIFTTSFMWLTFISISIGGYKNKQLISIQFIKGVLT